MSSHRRIGIALFLGALPLTYVAAAALQGRLVADPGQPEQVSCAHGAQDTCREVKHAIWEECEYLYQNATEEEIEAEIATLRDAIRADATDYYESRFAIGDFVIEGRYEEGQPYEVRPLPDELCARRLMPDGIVGKVVLPERDFPEAYALMYRGQWLQSHKLGRSEEAARVGSE